LAEAVGANNNQNKEQTMGGWKTWTGTILIGLSAAMRATGYEEYASIVEAIGGMLGLVGIGHKIEKSR
jgi:hypothetical protein